jgi:diacylglycerol kinase family enzyme
MTVLGRPDEGWRPVAAAERPVLLVNPRSGDGVAGRLGLAEKARDLGIHVVELTPGDSCAHLARTAVEGGADALGMAGGDGSLAVVAAVAIEHGVPFVCVPAGTRNHFALDVGVDRRDVLGSLAAFGEAVESRVDVADVNGRMFLNNVSLGIYGEAPRGRRWTRPRPPRGRAGLEQSLHAAPTTGRHPADVGERPPGGHRPRRA